MTLLISKLGLRPTSQPTLSSTTDPHPSVLGPPRTTFVPGILTLPSPHRQLPHRPPGEVEVTTSDPHGPGGTGGRVPSEASRVLTVPYLPDVGGETPEASVEVFPTYVGPLGGTLNPHHV